MLIKRFLTTEYDTPQDCEYCLAGCCIQQVDVYLTADLSTSEHVIHNDACEVMHLLN